MLWRGFQRPKRLEAERETLTERFGRFHAMGPQQQQEQLARMVDTELRKRYPQMPQQQRRDIAGGMAKEAQGRVQDDDRVAYLREHIAAVGRALQQGVPMAGYMVWSLMDNFEWASGYLKRFGIVHVDYATQVRTPKAI